MAICYIPEGSLNRDLKLGKALHNGREAIDTKLSEPTGLPNYFFLLDAKSYRLFLYKNFHFKIAGLVLANCAFFPQITK